MSGTDTRGVRVAVAALMLPVATVAVHQLRYLLVYGHHAGRALHAQGDGYVGSLIPWLTLLGGLGLSGLGLLLARALATGDDGRRPKARLALLWAGAAAALLVGYVLQEGLELLFGGAHESLVSLALGQGGWTAVPICLLAGFVWALCLQGALKVVALVGRRACGPPRRRPRLPESVIPADLPVPLPASPLARCVAGRAPPFASALG